MKCPCAKGVQDGVVSDIPVAYVTSPRHKATSVCVSIYRCSDDQYDDPAALWDAIKNEFQEIKLDGQYELAKLTTCQIASYGIRGVPERIAAQDKIIEDLSTHITIEEIWRKHYIISNLPCE